MLIADTLSQAYQTTTEGTQTEHCDIRVTLETVDHTMKSMMKSMARADCPSAVLPYYDQRSDLIESERLIYRGEQLVVLRSLRKEMVSRVHSSHIGIGGCLRCAREVLYWPMMSAEIKDYIAKYGICQTYQPAHGQE